MTDSPVAADDPCVFCLIVAGALPAHILHEDESTIALLDVNPAGRGHTLVVPRRHSRNLLDIEAADAAAVMETARVVGARLMKTLEADGLSLFQANEPAGWQTVFHTHLHVVPRWAADSLARPWVPTPGDPDQLAMLAARITDDTD